jgi:hypothetical protein
MLLALSFFLLQYPELISAQTEAQVEVEMEQEHPDFYADEPRLQEYIAEALERSSLPSGPSKSTAGYRSSGSRFQLWAGHP